MNNDNNAIHTRIFSASCVALIVTAMTFAVRAGILGELSQTFNLSDTQLGWVNAMAFAGFPVATLLGGGLYNTLGAKTLLLVAFIGHLVGLLLTIFAQGFWTLLISTFCIGFANGAVEAGCNPMIASMYKDQKTAMLNKFHVWFPGGIVIGALLSQSMTSLELSWQLQIAMMIIPTFIYGYLVFGVRFPEDEQVGVSTLSNVQALLTPLFLFMVFCMTLTATAELGTQQWVERILGASGASPMIILALVTGLMAVGRYFAGSLIKHVQPVGVLLGSAVITTLGIYLLSVVTGPMVYVAAVVFALGVTYFWPTIIGFVAENIPRAGALGMSIIGGAGMLAVSLWNPVIGRWLDSAKLEAQAQNLSGATADLVAGQTVLSNLLNFPAVLIIAFGLLYWVMHRRKTVG